jgi:hypothetical protein
MTTEILTKTEINCETGEVTVTPLSADEIAELEERKAAAKIKEQEMFEEAQAKAEAKASAEAKLAALGLTAEEIAAL